MLWIFFYALFYDNNIFHFTFHAIRSQNTQFLSLYVCAVVLSPQSLLNAFFCKAFCGGRRESFRCFLHKIHFCLLNFRNDHIRSYLVTFQTTPTPFRMECTYFNLTQFFSLCGAIELKSFAHIMRRQGKRIFQHLPGHDRPTLKFPNRWHRCCLHTTGHRY